MAKEKTLSLISMKMCVYAQIILYVECLLSSMMLTILTVLKLVYKKGSNSTSENMERHDRIAKRNARKRSIAEVDCDDDDGEPSDGIDDYIDQVSESIDRDALI